MEELFCVGFGDAGHIDVARAQKGLVAVAHVELESGEVPKVLCVVARVGVAEDVLHPGALESGFVAYAFPALAPARGADGGVRHGAPRLQKRLQGGAYFDMAHAPRL